MSSVARRFAVNMVMGIFGKAPKKKVTKGKYQRDLNLAHLCGEMTVCEHIINTNRNSPYESIDILIGELQTILYDCNEECRVKLNVSIPCTELETIIERSGY